VCFTGKFQKFTIKESLFSLAVTVKMNIFLFAPAVFFIMLFSIGIRKTVANLALCAIVQLIVGFEFLSYDPLAYLGRAFELGRVFQYRWSVNWQFVDESVFLATNFHLILLCAHLILLVVFILTTWFRRHGGFLKLAVDFARNGTLVELDTHGLH
jgi:alpha-1,3-mannosyltransferase